MSVMWTAKAMEHAIRSTAAEDSYDEIVVRHAVSSELAELIVDARRQLEERRKKLDEGR